MFALSIGQICHFGNMMIPNHTTKARQIRIIDQNDSAIIPTPNQLALFRLKLFFTEYAISHGKNVNENGI
jgi:hypothetical protein